MPDNFCVPYAERNADPSERGVHLTFGEREWATFSRFINRSAEGAAYDATTRVGCPLVGQGGGVYVADDAGSYVQGAAYAAGVAMAGEHQIDAAPAADRIAVQNGAQHLARVKSTGRFEASLNSGATYSTADWSFTGRGPFHWAITHDGANQNLYINRRLADSDAVVLGIPAGSFQIGRAGTSRRVRFMPTQPVARTVYLRDFAKRIVYQWAPHDVGEGPAGGIPTGAVGEGDWYCPSGGATLQHVWRNDLSVSGGGRLALTDSGAPSLRRLAYMHDRRPCFGSWVLRYEVRDPATDSLQFALSPLRDNDYSAAASASYWVHLRQVAGPWWRASLYLANGAQLDAVDTPALPIVGDRGVLLLTHHVDGTWQIYNYLRSLRSWYWSVASPLEVTALSTNYVHIAPRGAYVEGFTRFQGEADPHELEIAVP